MMMTEWKTKMEEEMMWEVRRLEKRVENESILNKIEIYAEAAEKQQQTVYKPERWNSFPLGV